MYREPWIPESQKENIMAKIFEKIGNILSFLFLDTVIGWVILVFGGVGFLIFLGAREVQATSMRNDYNRYVRNREICELHDGWYNPNETVTGIGNTIAICHHLGTNQRFYVIRESGRVLVEEETE